LITVDAADDNLQELDLSFNYLQSQGAIKVARGMRNSTTLKCQVI